MQTLQRYASDLQSRYDGVSTQLASQKLAFNALGMLGMPMVAAVNSSGDKSVDKAKHAAETMGQVRDGLRATAETSTNTDQFIADQFSKIVPDSGAKNPQGSQGIAPKPTPTAGPQVSDVKPVPGAQGPDPIAAPPQTGPEVNQVQPIPGANGTTAPASVPSPTGPPVAPINNLPGAPGTTAPASAPNPTGPPMAPPPPIPGSQGTTTTAGFTPPPSSPPPAQPPTLKPPAPPGSTPPRPGVIPNVPGVSGPPKGIFTPTPPAADSLRPIANANPPAKTRPPGMPLSKAPAAPPVTTNPSWPGGSPPAGGFPAPPGASTPPAGTISPPTGPNPLGPIGDANPPAHPRPDVQPNPRPDPDAIKPPTPQPTPPPVAPVKAPPNILDLLDPRGYPGGEHLPQPDGPKTDGAWPATTIDGKPWADLSDLTPDQSQKWIDNLRNILATKEDGAFFWSGSVYDADGNRISVMDEAGEIAQNNGRNTLEGLLDDKGVKLPGWGNTSPEGKAVWDSVSASLAHGSSGDVYVLLGPSRRPDNVFHMTEFPILEQNPNVKRVIAVDVLTKQETVILTK